jgi:membrane protein implicated in regulation of membrane protease activity
MRLPERDARPSALLWLAAVASLLLPVAGVALSLYGVFEIANEETSGWYWVGAGTLLVIADMVVDWVWARPAVGKSDEPNLNRRGAELVGQILMVVEPIEAEGRGKVRAADTVWAAEGVKAPVGKRVRVVGVKGTVLTVVAT